MSSEPSTSTGLDDTRVPSRNVTDNTAEHSRVVVEASNKPNEKVPSSEVKHEQAPDAVKKDEATKPINKNIKAEDKKGQALAQKKAFDDRFKKRGKRPPPPREEGEEDPNKKPKRELTAYEKEVQKYESRILKDHGSGVRSVMK